MWKELASCLTYPELQENADADKELFYAGSERSMHHGAWRSKGHVISLKLLNGVHIASSFPLSLIFLVPQPHWHLVTYPQPF
jgi:hypothetical protein